MQGKINLEGIILKKLTSYQELLYLNTTNQNECAGKDQERTSEEAGFILESNAGMFRCFDFQLRKIISIPWSFFKI